MRWEEGFDKSDQLMLSAFSAVVPGEGDLGFEWRVTQLRAGWSVKESAAELLTSAVREKNFRFDSSGKAIEWCEREEARIVAEYREASAA